MEVFYDLVRRVAKGFEELGVDYAFTGALAASFYGVPRTTVDVDVVVVVSGVDDKARLVEALKSAGLIVDERAINRALESGYRIATFRDSKTAYTVDVILSDKKLEKRAGTVVGMATFFQTPEDLILAKLRMIKATVPRERALKDVEDVRAVLKFADVNVVFVRERAKGESTLALFEELAF